MTTGDTLRRSMLAIPANEQRLIAAAADSNADEVVFDLEDSLAPGEKPAARTTLIEAVESHDWEGTGLSYRINGTDTRWWYEDVIEPISAVGDSLDCLILPKVTDGAEVKTVATLLDSVETNVGCQPQSTALSVQIETATGMNNAIEIASASDRLTALIFGPADYAASVGATAGSADYPGHYWQYPLSRVAHAAAGANLLTIGGPFAAVDDPSGFREACTRERALGYDGKMLIHPDQIETANEIFAPTLETAQRAQRIVDRYQEADPAEVIAIDGKVIDKEMYRMAERIRSKAEKAGII